MQYTITRTPAALGSPDAVWDGPVWQQAEELAVAHFPWSDSGHHPARRLASFTMTNFSESSSVEKSEADGDTILVAHSMPKIVDPEITEATVWTVEYHVPFTLFASYFEVFKPTSGNTMEGKLLQVWRPDLSSTLGVLGADGHTLKELPPAHFFPAPPLRVSTGVGSGRRNLSWRR